MNRRTMTIALALLFAPLVTASAGLDPYGTKQTAGIFVTVDGRMHTIYLDFSAAAWHEDQKNDIPVTLTTDIDTWIEGHPLPAGRHEWTFRPEDDGTWTMGPPPPRKRTRKPVERFHLTMKSTEREASWLTASFSPEPSTESVLVHLHYGKREGTLRLALREGGAANPGKAPDVDLVRLRAIRDRLREVAGTLEDARSSRHEWSLFLADLGDALLADGGQGWLTSLALERDEKQVSLSVSGIWPGKRDGIDAFGKRVAKSELGRIFHRVELPIARVRKAGGWTFDISAEETPEAFDRTSPVPALADGDDPAKTAEEILLLEERLDRLTGSSATDLPSAQSLLLSAKRDSGALISRIEPAKVEGRSDEITQFRVVLVASGAGSTLVRLIRALEESPAPLRILPRSIRQGDFSPQITMELTFLGYRSLSERDPALLASIRRLGMSPEFDRNREIYLQGLGSPPTRPFVAPRWPRDPFAPPPEKKDGDAKK